LSAGFFPIFKNTSREDYFPLDLSVENQLFTLSILEDPDRMQETIDHITDDLGKKVPYGGYFEKRKLYERSAHFGEKENRRNLHLGVDFWASSGTEVLCPMEGIVHSFKNNINFGDYGPTIILKHTSHSSKVFYSLYGHLSKESISSINIGDHFEKGEIIAELGNSKENGNYAPHLHLQLIKDIGEYNGDYPGVCSENDRELYQENCPNPLDFIGF
tara:strand:+ start:106324 stop:106971 length:648 start_codon:yes stop_codon:yes gene_type:complete